MTLLDLIKLFRTEAFDNSNPPLFSDEDIIVWLNEAQIEACVRATHLIRENVNPLLTQFDIQEGVMDYEVDKRMIQIEYASLIYKGSLGMLPYVLAITTAEELDAVRPFWRTLPFRPTGIIHYDTSLRTDCIPNTAYTIHTEGYRLPLWSMDLNASAEVLATGTVTLTGGTSGQVSTVTVNGIDILGSLVAFNTDLATTAADVATQINANQNKFTAAAVGAVITITDIATSGSLHNGWVVAATSIGITTSTSNMTGGVDAVVDTPEINGVHHRHLVKWALHRGYQRPDAETFDPDKSARALLEFENMFGKRPDAAYRKRQNSSRPHRNTSYA